MAVDSAGTCYLAGTFSGQATFDAKVLISSSKSDAIVAKLMTPGADSPLSLSIQPLGDRAFQVQFTGDACSSYRLQASPDLKEWSTLLTTNSPTGPVMYLDSPTAKDQRFFRVISP